MSPSTSRRRSLVKWPSSGNWMGPLDPPPPCCSRGTPLTMNSSHSPLSTHISLIVNRSSSQPLIRSQNCYTVSNYLRIMCAMKRRSRHCSNYSWMMSTGLNLSREHLRYDWIQLIYPKYCSQFFNSCITHTDFDSTIQGWLLWVRSTSPQNLWFIQHSRGWVCQQLLLASCLESFLTVSKCVKPYRTEI